MQHPWHHCPELEHLDQVETSHFCFQQKLLISAQNKTCNITTEINKQPPASKHIWIHEGLHTPYKANDAIVFNILRVPNRHISQVHLQIKPHESRDTFAGEKIEVEELYILSILLCSRIAAIFMGI